MSDDGKFNSIQSFSEKMAYAVPAQDIGFTVSKIGSTAKGREWGYVSSSDSLIIDGFSFPKNIPEPVFIDDSEMYFTRY